MSFGALSFGPLAALLSSGPSIPFHTLSERHLVYAYCVVWLLQFGYGGRVIHQWLALRKKSNGAR